MKIATIDMLIYRLRCLKGDCNLVEIPMKQGYIRGNIELLRNQLNKMERLADLLEMGVTEVDFE